MRTRFSSHLSVRSARSVPAATANLCAVAPSDARPFARAGFSAARRLSLALVIAPLCAGALLARPVHAAPTVESDENGPLVQIVKPGYNDVLKGKYRIFIQVTARKYNPQSVEMFIDDVSATDGPMPISSFASSSYDFDTRKMTDGRHKLTVRVTDSQGFRGWSEVTVFVNNKGVVDTQVPDLKWVGIEPFQEFSGSMKIEVDAADNFGVKWLHLSINPADTPNKPAYSWMMMSKPPYQVNLDTVGKNIPDGLYVLKALAFDSLDQQGEATPLTIGIVNDQINATRVEDMLDGKKQMAQILQSQKPAEKAAPTKTAPTKVAQSPAKTAKVPAKVAEAPAVTTPPQRVTTPSAPALLLPTPKLAIPQQVPSNPGIQLPSVNASAATSPTPAAPQEVPAPTSESETRIAESDSVEVAPTEIESAEVAPTAVESAIAEKIESAPLTETAPTSEKVETAPTTDAAPATSAEIEATPRPIVPPVTVEVAPMQNAPQASAPKTLVAKLPSRPVGQRNASEANLSRAGAVNLAMTPASPIAPVRASAPIAVARFGLPHLSGRAISDAPAWSQNATGDESRLSNAELSRARAGKTRVLNASRQLTAQISVPTASARTLQTSAPTLGERPILARAVTPNTISAPAPKLTRQAKTQAAPLAPKTGALSKAVAKTGRALPIAPPQAATSARKNQNVQPVELEIAPAFVAKSNAKAAQAPQLSAPTAPRMSESASGLGAPSKLAKAVQRLTGKAQKVESQNGQRIAALPRPDAVTRNRSGAAIVAVPLNEPLQLADSTAQIPTSYRAEQTTTLRAIAARFGLPVELVAISNGWTSEMKVLRGMEVKLPRPLNVSYNGVPVKGDTPSMLMGDTAVTAFRFMFEKTGGKLEWDATNQRVVARKDGREIVLTIGSDVAKVGDREVMMEIAAFLFQGRTMVPLRFFEEGMNAQVEWNPQTGRLVVAMAS